MLSRGNSEASARLRRAKSSASIRTRQYAPIEPVFVDPLIAKEHALVAATHAFGRATGTSTDSQDGGSSTSQTGNNELKLSHQKSVRFTGPAAIPIRKLPITRREAKECNYGPQSKQASLQPNSKHDSSSVEDKDDLIATLPLHSEYVETRVTSLPSSYRKLRKSKSMLGSPLLSRPRQNPKTYFDGMMQTRSRLQRSFSFLRSNTGQPPYETESQATIRVEATQFARDQYIRQLEQQRMDEQLSPVTVGQDRKSCKAFRKTVRTSSTNSYDNASASQPFNSVDNMDGKALGSRARVLSSSLKSKLKRAFQRSSEPELTVPPQQLDSTRAHFGRNFWASIDRDNLLPSTEVSTDGTLTDHRLRQPSPAQTSDRQGSTTEIRGCEYTDGDAVDSHSRVTSWTDSTAANTITLTRISNGQRLSVVQENGGFSQRPIFGERAPNPATIPNGCDRRLRKSSLYTILQDKINNKHIPFRTSAHKDNAEAKRAENARSTSRAQSGECASLLSCPRTGSRKANDLYNAAQNLASAAINPQLLVDVKNDQIKEIIPQTEISNFAPKNPLREVKSIFFPSLTHIERCQTSPFRQAMQSSCHIEKFPDFSRASGQISMSSENSENFSPMGAASNRSLTRSDSIYSRTSSGNTPKLAASSPSLMSLDGYNGLSTTISFPESQNQPCLTARPVSPSASAARRGFDRSNQIEKSVMQSEACTPAGIINDFSAPTRTLCHKRENAQISDDDTNLGNLPGPNSSKRPLAGVAIDASFRSRKGTSQPMIDRFPLMDIETQPNVPKVESQIPVFSRTAKSLVENNSGEGSSSNHEYKSSDDCDLQRTHTSLTHQSPRPFTYNTPAANDVGDLETPQGVRWKSQKLTVPPMNSHSRSSPERVARLRQIHGRIPSPRKKLDPSYISQQNQRTPENRKASIGILKELATEPESNPGQGGVASEGQNLVEYFLSNRSGHSGGSKLAPLETGEAAFI